ncbi:MAG: ABC transporter ATP-binding protein [Candidatus Bathyarchaeia archaeon]
MLRTESINAGYGELHVLFDVSVGVREKEITILIGPNGSGKSTLLKTILGLTKVYSGKILFGSKNIIGLSPHEITKLGIAYLPQTDNVFVNLKVKENLLMAGYTLNKADIDSRMKEVLEDFPFLKDYMNRKVITLSGGERQMLAMAMALMRKPKLMLFDEPTASLSPKIATQVFEKIMELRDYHGITVLIAEQNAKKALEYGDRAILLASGRVMHEDDSKKLLSHPEFGKVYLGIKEA